MVGSVCHVLAIHGFRLGVAVLVVVQAVGTHVGDAVAVGSRKEFRSIEHTVLDVSAVIRISPVPGDHREGFLHEAVSDVSAVVDQEGHELVVRMLLVPPSAQGIHSFIDHSPDRGIEVGIVASKL